MPSISSQVSLRNDKHVNKLLRSYQMPKISKTCYTS